MPAAKCWIALISVGPGRRQAATAAPKMAAPAGMSVKAQADATGSRAAVLPMRVHVLSRLREMHVSIDVIDPGQWDEMVTVAVGGRIVLGELDLVLPLQVVNCADVLSVGGADLHVLFDLRGVDHRSSPWDCETVDSLVSV